MHLQRQQLLGLPYTHHRGCLQQRSYCACWYVLRSFHYPVTSASFFPVIAPCQLMTSPVAVETFAVTMCAGVGVTLNIPSAGPATTNAPPATQAPASGASTVFVTVPCSTSVSSSSVVAPTTLASN